MTIKRLTIKKICQARRFIYKYCRASRFSQYKPDKIQIEIQE